ncbi:MAG: asparagine synthase (glutamine-hydrolyzing) [Acidobacteriota bacterium]
MCGIAGYVARQGDGQAELVRSMCDEIRHRGPDDEGYYVAGPCAIGMRRLSIIDLSTGHQPISNEDGSIWVVFNGEIYNYQELRRDLISRGHKFRTNSDTETLIHLYEEEGVAGISKLRGMFAYAIWDGRDRSLLLVRDRFGKKPLYYANTPAGFYFGSELKCLRAAGVPLEPDDEALKLYFQFTYIPEPWSAFRAIRKVPPGSWMRVDQTGSITQGAYWKLPTPTEHAPEGISEDQMAVKVRDAFDEAVRIRMIADVPLGAFLSGGVDSSSVVASMALQSSEPVKTFSIGFEENKFNELPYARMIAEKYKTDHHEIVVRPDAIDLVSKLIHHFDEPFGDSSAIPTYIVSQFAAKEVKVVLTGDGGDELFAGYDTFFQADRLRNYDRVPGVAKKFLGAIAGALPYSAYGKNYLRMISRPTSLERYFEGTYSPYFLRQQLLRPEWMLPTDEAHLRSTFTHCLAEEGRDILTQALVFEATSKLTGDMLVKVDRMSMANSLEVRCPLLDYVLADLAATIPTAWNMKNGAGKQMFVKAMGERLPSALVNRPKQGFGVPLAAWFRGPLRSFVRDHLIGGRCCQRGIVSPEFLTHLLDEHDSGRRDNHHWMWTLLMLELWFREWESTSPTRMPAAGTACLQ